MAQILVKGIPSKLHRDLKARAQRNRRSMNQEVLTILEQSLQRVQAITVPKPMKPLKPITDDEIIRAVREGRE
jgi:plasmid stability protein